MDIKEKCTEQSFCLMFNLVPRVKPTIVIDEYWPCTNYYADNSSGVSNFYISLWYYLKAIQLIVYYHNIKP